MMQKPEDEGFFEALETKPFLAHLEDLRWTILKCAGALAVAVATCAFSAKFILQALYVPFRRTGHRPEDLINIGVVDPFSIHMEISIFGGVIFALPVMLYFLAQFLLPALTSREKKFIAPVFAVGAFLFLIGVSFCYAFVLQTTLQFFSSYSDYLGFESKWTAKGLIDFEVQMLLGFGLAFELPLVMLVLNLLGIISAAQMASKRRHAAFGIFAATCCIIPSTDLFSLSLLAVPMYLLYEICIIVARIAEKRKASSQVG